MGGVTAKSKQTDTVEKKGNHEFKNQFHYKTL